MRSLFASIASVAMLVSSATASAEMPRISTPIDDQEKIAGNPWIPWAIALIAAIAIILVITDDNEDPESP